jgi:AcrR family transcriptional regulator
VVTKANSATSPIHAKPLSRRERKRNETVEKLLQAAIELFAENGFANTPVEEITERADVSKGTFFNYFPSKEHILMHFVGRQVGIIESYLEQARAGKKSIESLLHSLAQDLTLLPGRTPELARSIMASFLSNEQVRQVMREQIAGRGRAVLAQIIAIGQERGEIRRDNPSIDLARAFQQGMFGAVLLWSLNPIDSLSGVIERLVGVLWSGLQLPPTNLPTISRKKVKK